MGLYDPQGDALRTKSAMKYLGAQLAADGHLESEVAQKIGEATQVFKTLKSIWGHCNISNKFKLVVYSSCVVQKLLYGLDSAWLSAALLKKLDGFHAKCLRRLLKISPSYISRVSNQYVLNQLNAQPLSKTLLQRQLFLFGHIARLSSDNVVRNSVFVGDTVQLHVDQARKQGRPRNTWASELCKIALTFVGDQVLSETLSNKVRWDAAVKRFCGT